MGFRVKDVEGNELLFVPISEGDLEVEYTAQDGTLVNRTQYAYGSDISHVDVTLPMAEIAAAPALSEPESEVPEAPMIGALVHYRMPTNGQTRPAIVVNPSAGNPERRANLVVFVDGSNDGYSAEELTRWATSVPYSEGAEPGTWRYALQPA